MRFRIGHVADFVMGQMERNISYQQILRLSDVSTYSISYDGDTSEFSGREILIMRKLTLTTMMLVSLISIFMPLEISQAAAQQPIWSVEYYNNTNLMGPIVYTAQVDIVGFDWTAFAPVPGVNADFFSARWTSIQNLDAGTYEVSVRADDGVRVFVNNAPLIDEFHTSSGLTYTETFDVPAGQHVIQVDYYEGGGVAFLDFEMNRVSSNRDQPLAIVLANRLNVRDKPSVLTGDVVTQVTRNEALSVIGRTADSQWWRIFANGITGWVSGQWVDVSKAVNVPVIEDETPEVTGYMLTASANLNIRSGPSVAYSVVGWLPYQQTATIIGRNADNSWWQIQYGDVTGWVSDVYSQLQFGVDINNIPVTEGLVQTYTLTATANLNIRSGPSVAYSIVGWLPYRQTATIIGRTADVSWWQIQYRGVMGWVSAFYTTPGTGIDINNIPVTG